MTLDLSNADTAGFEPLPSGTYGAEVFEIRQQETKGSETAKLPAGTPMWNVQFKVTEPEDYENRRVFRNYVISPAKINGKNNPNKAKTDGMIVSFLEAIGYDKEEIMSGNFEPDFEDMIGRPCRVVVGQREYNGEIQNDVKGVKAPGEVTAGGLL